MTRDGPFYASTEHADQTLYLDLALSQDEILRTIRDAVARRGGPVDINVPLDGR
jgi:hypothetical protein